MRKKFNKSSSKKPPRKSSDFKRNKDNRLDSKDVKDEKNNDPKWHTGDSTLTYDAGRFNWLVPNGSIIDTIPGNPFTFPGVVGLRIVPGVGVSVDDHSVVNVAARKLYTWIRRSKSSYATYDPSDLMQYCIAVGQAYQYHAWMCRLYGLLNVYSVLNRYIPDALISANFVDKDDLRSNMSDLLFYINKFGNQIASLAVPSTLPYFDRTVWLYSNVYTDDPSGKSTMYEFVPAGFYTYSHSTASCVWQPIPQTTPYKTFSDIITLGDAMLSDILTTQDFWNISADILNAYGDGNLLKVPALDVNYLVLPTFDLMTLSMIQNAWICGNPSTTQHALDITQGANGEILWNPKFPPASIGTGADVIYTSGRRIINMYKDTVNPDDVFECTRFAPTFYKLSSDPHNVYIDGMGTEFIASGVFWFYDVTNGVRTLTNVSFTRCKKMGNDTSGITKSEHISSINIASRLSEVAYHPYVHLYFTENVNAVETYSYGMELGDVSNFTIMDDDDLVKLHTASLFSLFNVPTLGGFNG